MSNVYPRSAGAAHQPAPLLSSDKHRLCDKIDADNEWDLASQQGLSDGDGFSSQIATSFEFDIHDCSVSEVNR